MQLELSINTPTIAQKSRRSQPSLEATQRAIALMAKGCSIRLALKLTGATLSSVRLEVNSQKKKYQKQLSKSFSAQLSILKDERCKETVYQKLEKVFASRIPSKKVKTLQRVITLYRQGHSIRKLEKRFGISRSNIHYHIQNAGQGGIRQKQTGLFNVVEENIHAIKSARRKKEAEAWLKNNMEYVLEADEDGEIDLLSRDQEVNLTWQQTGANKDYGELLATWWDESFDLEK